MSAVVRVRDRSWPWSVLFWCTVPVSLYGSLYAMTGEWWWTVGITAVAVAALVAWSKPYSELTMGRARQIWRWTSALVLVVCALGLFSVAGRELFGDKSIHVGGSGDPRRAACGSVVEPRPNDMLTAEFPDGYSDEVRRQFGPLSYDYLGKRCDERLDSSAGFAVATAVGAAQLAVRALMHLTVRRVPLPSWLRERTSSPTPSRK